MFLKAKNKTGNSMKDVKMSDSTAIQGNNNNTINVTNNTINISNGNVTVTLNRVGSPLKDFVGRGKELEDLTNELKNEKRIAIIHGWGGMGKTAFVRKLVSEIDKKRENSAWLNYNGSVNEMLSMSQVSVSNVNDPKDFVHYVMNHLIGLDKDFLLVIDNAVYSRELKEFIDRLRCRVIITTRTPMKALLAIDDTTECELRELDTIDEKRELFNTKCFGKHVEIEPSEINDIDAIIDLTGGLTLAIELIGRLCRNYSPQELLEKLQSCGFDLKEAGLIDTVSPLDDPKNKHEFAEHMEKLFDISALSEDCKRIMRQLAVIKPNSTPKRVIKEWMGLLSFNEIEDLIDSGWLHEDNGGITLHDAIALTLDASKNNKPQFSECTGIMAKVIDEMKPKDDRDLVKYNYPRLNEAKNIANRFFDWHKLLDNGAEDSDILNLGVLNDEIGVICQNQADYSEALRFYKNTIDIREKLLGSEHIDTAASYNNIGILYKTIGFYDKALDYYNKALATRKKLLCLAHPDIASSYNNIGRLYKAMGSYNEALRYHKHALDLRKTLIDPKGRDTAMSYNNLGRLYIDMGKFDKATENLNLGLAIRREILGENNIYTANSYNNKGKLYHNMRHFNEALDYYNESLSIYGKQLHSDHPYIKSNYNNMGKLYHNIGEFDNALECLNKAIVGKEELPSSEHIDTSTSYNNNILYKAMGNLDNALEWHITDLAIMEKLLNFDRINAETSYNSIYLPYVATGGFDKVFEYYSKTLVIKEKLLGTNHISTATCYNNIAMLYKAMGDFDNALVYHEKALSVMEELLGFYHLNTATCYNNIASLYHAIGDFGTALKYYNRDLIVKKRLLGSKHIFTATSYNNIGKLHYDMGNNNKAFRCLTKALNVYEQSLGFEHIDTATCYNNIGLLYHDMGDFDNALIFLNKALAIKEKCLVEDHPHTKITRKNMKLCKISMATQRIFCSPLKALRRFMKMIHRFMRRKDKSEIND